MKNRQKRLLALVLSFVLAVGMVTPGFAANGGNGLESGAEIHTATPSDLLQMETQTTSPAALIIAPLNDASVSTFIDLQAAINAVPMGESATITITDEITIPSGSNIFDGTGRNITLLRSPSFTGNLITVPSGSTLDLENIVIDGWGAKSTF